MVSSRAVGPLDAHWLDGSKAHVFGNNHLHDFACTAIDSVNSHIGIGPGDGILVDVAVATVQLQESGARRRDANALSSADAGPD